MIKAENVFKLIKKNLVSTKKVCSIPLIKANGMILAENIKSDINIPPQNNSAVDGYAFNYKKSIKNKDFIFNIVDKLDAGAEFKGKISPYECIKVSTGAHLPSNLDTVIMLEDTKIISKNKIFFKKSPVYKKNVRNKAEDIKKGKIILKKNHLLRVQDIGIIASIGKNKLKVYKKLNIGLLSNGNELVEPGREKTSTQIYDSNRFMLSSLTNTNYSNSKDFGILKDNYNSIKKKIEKIKTQCDLIIISGGASFGDKDYIIDIVKSMGKIIFWKVSIKPGRPFALGILEKKTPILILPGNPVASFVIFNIFGKYLIHHIINNKSYLPNYFIVKSNFNMRKKLGREEYLRGKVFFKDNIVFADKYRTEGAGILSSTVWANGLIRLRPHLKSVKKNDDIDFFPFESFK